MARRNIQFCALLFALWARQVVGFGLLQGFAINTNPLFLSTKSKSPQVRLRSTEVSKETPSFEPQTTTIPTTTTTTTNSNNNGTSLFETAGTVVDPITSSTRRTTNSKHPKTFELWKRRLITHEDPWSLHKLAAGGYTLSSVILLGSAAIRWSTSSELFAILPPEMEGVLNIFTLSNCIMCAVSVRMAFLHRQGDIKARNAFLGTATSSLFSGFFMVWVSPYVEGTIFDTIWISRSCFAALLGLNGYFIADTLLHTDAIVESRRDRNAPDYQGRPLVDTFLYIFPVAWGAPLILATGYITCVLHDRQWFLEQCQFIDQQMPYPGIQSHIFYSQVSTSLAASYASVFVTLRDKKLISKQQEWGGITLFSMPALMWSIYITVIFISFLFEPH